MDRPFYGNISLPVSSRNWRTVLQTSSRHGL